MDSIRTTIRSFEDMEPTYSEITEALKALGFKRRASSKVIRFENEKYRSIILLPVKKPDELLPRARFAAVSQELEIFGVVQHMDDLGKMIKQKRLSALTMAA